MTHTHLKKRMLKAGLTQSALAARLSTSTASISLCIAHNKAPKSRPKLAHEIAKEIANESAKQRASEGKKHAAASGSKQNAQRSSAERSTAAKRHTKKEEVPMLLQKQTLHQATRRHFALAADPFNNDITDSADVFVSPDVRYVRETLWQHAKHGGLLALVGESGSGKSTIVADFKDRLHREGRNCVIIEPSVLYMEENDAKGKTLKSAAIVQAIIATVAPGVSPKRDAEARARQVQQILTAGHRAGQRHVLIIEEAHCLPIATLKHLKRFAELKDGLAPLLSIVLVGQPELRQRLAVNNAEVREVAQRCDIIELPPLDNHLSEYLRFKLQRVGCALEKIITPEGIDALRQRLTFANRRASANGNLKSHTMASTSVSLVYPLAVANALIAAMNLATSLGAPVVDTDVIGEV